MDEAAEIEIFFSFFPCRAVLAIKVDYRESSLGKQSVIVNEFRVRQYLNNSNQLISRYHVSFPPNIILR